jgi:hypothetical protein
MALAQTSRRPLFALRGIAWRLRLLRPCEISLHVPGELDHQIPTGDWKRKLQARATRIRPSPLRATLRCPNEPHLPALANGPATPEEKIGPTAPHNPALPVAQGLRHDLMSKMPQFRPAGPMVSLRLSIPSPVSANGDAGLHTETDKFPSEEMHVARQRGIRQVVG